MRRRVSGEQGMGLCESGREKRDDVGEEEERVEVLVGVGVGAVSKKHVLKY